MGQQISNEHFKKQCEKAARPPVCYQNLQKISRLCDQRDTMRTPVCRQLQAALFNDWEYFNGTHHHCAPGSKTGPPPANKQIKSNNNNNSSSSPPAESSVGAGNSETLIFPKPRNIDPHPVESDIPPAENGHVDKDIVHIERSLFDVTANHAPDSFATGSQGRDHTIHALRTRRAVSEDNRGVAAVSVLVVLFLLSAVLVVSFLARRRKAAAKRRRDALASESSSIMFETDRL